MLLSAALIVRDEAKRLEPCLRSIEPFVDEVVLVDTGSMDDTVAMARAHGARTFEYRWHDDFSAARNFGLERCRGRWILYIDADERARPLARVELETALSGRDVAALTVLFHAQTGFSAYRELRLFRNDHRIRFTGIMHETIWPGVRCYVDETGSRIGDCDLTLEHVGYDGPQDHKYRRNLPLLKKALAADPDHVYCWYDLGRTYRGLGETALALQAWQSAVAAVRRKSSRRPADSLPFIELIQHGMTHREPVPELLEEAQTLFPDDALLRWLDAHKRAADGRIEEAIATLQSLADDYQSQRLAPSIGYDPRQFTSHTYASIASCFYRLGKYGDAERYFALALRHEPDNLEYLTKQRLCAQLESDCGSDRPV